jgi:hypothetical protein
LKQKLKVVGWMLRANLVSIFIELVRNVKVAPFQQAFPMQNAQEMLYND